MSAKFASNPTCEGKKFYVEVTGIKHGSEQDFEFYDLTDMSQQSALENKKLVDPELDDSTVYSWDWCDENANRNVWLKIEAEDGPIKLPLFQDVTAISRKQDEQDYLVHAFLPMTLLPTQNNKAKQDERLAPVRDGYLYIIYNGKFWREIEITTGANSTTLYQDVNLYKYRSGRDNPFKTNTLRPSTGLPLKELWYPAKENGKQADILIAFSEVQWSGARLNYLENNLTELQKRCKKPCMPLVKISELPEIRPRSLDIELQLAEPAFYNKSLTDTYIKGLLNNAKNERQRYVQEGTYNPDNTLEFEYSLRSSVLYEQLAQKQDQLIEEGRLDQGEKLKAIQADLLWETSTCKDFYQQAKKNQLRGVVLEDDLFNIRHQNSLVVAASNYLQQIQLDATHQPHYKSAELLQHFVLVPKIGEQDNPAYKFADKVVRTDQSTFSQTLRTLVRRKLHDDIPALQMQLSSQLEAHSLAESLRDITSLDDANVMGAYILVNNCRHAINIDSQKHDQLLPELEKQPSDLALNASKIFFSDSTHPLRHVLFGDTSMGTSLSEMLEDKEITPEYKQYADDSNDGSGLLTMGNLARLVATDLALEVDTVIQGEAEALVKAAEETEQSLFPQIRRFVNAADSAFSSFFENGMTLKNAIETETFTIKFNNLYVENLGLLKALSGDKLSSMVFKPVTGGEISGYILGLGSANQPHSGVTQGAQSYLYGNRGTKNSFGDITQDGAVVASTSKVRARSKADMPETAVSVVVLKDTNSELVRMLEHDKKLLKEVQNKSLSKTNAYEQLKIPVFIIAVEVWNVTNAWSYFRNNRGDVLYGVANLSSAILDIGVAAIHTRNLIKPYGNIYSITNVSKPMFKPETVAKYGNKNFAQLRGSISVLGIAGAFAGLVTAGLMVVDSVRLFSKQDNDAAIGAAMMAFGTAFGAIGGSVFSSAPIALGLGPIAWIALGITLAGFSIVYFCTDGPLETWLTNGPFAIELTDDASLKYLIDNPDYAFDQLLNLYVSLSIESHKIEEGPLTAVKKHQLKQQGITHYVHVRTNLSQLLNMNKEDISFNIESRELLDMYNVTSRYDPVMGTRNTSKSRYASLKPKSIVPVETINTSEGKLYLYKATHSIPPSIHSYRGSYSYDRRIQVMAQLRAGNFIFPQPPIGEVVVAKQQVDDGTIDINEPNFGDKKIESFGELIFSEPSYYWANSDDFIES